MSMGSLLKESIYKYIMYMGFVGHMSGCTVGLRVYTPHTTMEPIGGFLRDDSLQRDLQYHNGRLNAGESNHQAAMSWKLSSIK